MLLCCLLQAQPLMVEALELCKKLVGELHPHTASCESNIAGLLRHQVSEHIDTKRAKRKVYTIKSV